MELKSGEGTVVVADRDRCCNDGCNRNPGLRNDDGHY